MNISTVQVQEILDNGAWEISIRKSYADEGVYVVELANEAAEKFDETAGEDIGRLIDKLHDRL